MRREQRPDRIVEDEVARHPPACQERVGDHPPLENLDQRGANLALFGALLAPVLDPDRGLFDVIADPDNRQRGQHADPQHAAPADVVVEQPVDDARQQKADAPRALQHAAHKAARADRPLLHRERRACRPFRAHADAEEGTEDQQEEESRREARDEIANRVPEDRDHQRRLAADTVGEPARCDGADQPHPQGQREDDRDFGRRNLEFVGDRLDDQQKDGEVERVERPAQPGRPPRIPLVLGRLAPPRHAPSINRRHRPPLCSVWPDFGWALSPSVGRLNGNVSRFVAAGTRTGWALPQPSVPFRRSGSV